MVDLPKLIEHQTNDHSKAISDHKLLITKLDLACFHYALTFLPQMACIMPQTIVKRLTSAGAIAREAWMGRFNDHCAIEFGERVGPRTPLSLQRRDLGGFVDRNDAHVLIALLCGPM